VVASIENLIICRDAAVFGFIALITCEGSTGNNTPVSLFARIGKAVVSRQWSVEPQEKVATPCGQPVGR